MFKNLGVFVLLVGSFAFAEGPCKKDMETYCKSEMGDKMKMAQCMKDHAEGLSPECKAKVAEMKETISGLREACSNDIKTLCPDVDPGEKRLMKCLKENRKKVSSTCKLAMKAAGKNHKK